MKILKRQSSPGPTAVVAVCTDEVDINDPEAICTLCFVVLVLRLRIDRIQVNHRKSQAVRRRQHHQMREMCLHCLFVKPN